MTPRLVLLPTPTLPHIHNASQQNSGGAEPSINKPIHQDGFQLRKVGITSGEGRIPFT